MSIVGNKIYEIRKLKGYSQEKLAELSKINLRTIQRIENDENEPHGKTLNLICDVLEINVEELLKTQCPKKTLVENITNLTFLVLTNIIIISIIGYLILDSQANWNSRLGGFLFCLFMPYFIVSLTRNMKRTERVLKFGLGFVLYIILANIITEFHGIVVFVLTPSLLIAFSILYFGNSIIKLSD